MNFINPPQTLMRVLCASLLFIVPTICVYKSPYELMKQAWRIGRPDLVHKYAMQAASADYKDYERESEAIFLMQSTGEYSAAEKLISRMEVLGSSQCRDFRDMDKGRNLNCQGRFEEARAVLEGILKRQKDRVDCNRTDIILEMSRARLGQRDYLESLNLVMSLWGRGRPRDYKSHCDFAIYLMSENPKQRSTATQNQLKFWRDCPLKAIPALDYAAQVLDEQGDRENAQRLRDYIAKLIVRPHFTQNRHWLDQPNEG